MSNSPSRKLERTGRIKRIQEIKKALRYGIDQRERAVELACEYVKSFGCFPMVYGSGDDFVRISYCCEHGIQIDGVLILTKSTSDLKWRWSSTETTSYPCKVCEINPYDDGNNTKQQFNYES